MSATPHISQNSSRGFTLLVAIVLSSVALTLGIALLDIAYKQIVLSSVTKQSEVAFYAADSALECALYYDQKQGAFDYTTPFGSGSIFCGNVAISNYTTNLAGGTRTTSFDVGCPGGGISGRVTVYKTDGVAQCTANKTTCMYANGYSTCNSGDPRRIERGLKVTY